MLTLLARKFHAGLEKILPKPLRQGSRTYTFLFIPILAIVLFAGSMGLILWTLNYQDKNQQEYALHRDTAYTKQRIHNRFINNEEALLDLSREINEANNQAKYSEAFVKGATTLIQDNPEILHLRWIDKDKNKIWSIPTIVNSVEWHERAGIKNVLDRELNRVYAESIETSKSAYGHLIQLEFGTKDKFTPDREYVFWHVTPVIQSGHIVGGIAVLYSAVGIIKHMVPSDLLGLYRYTLLDDDGNELASSNAKKPKGKYVSDFVTLDKPNNQLNIHISSYPPPTNLTYKTLLWLVIGLSGFVLWSLWSVWRQTRERYAVQVDLQNETNFRRAMEESMTIGMRAHDLNGTITYVNPAFCKMTGWSKNELIGKQAPFPFWPVEMIPQLMRKMTTALQGDAPSSGIEAVLQRKDGTRITTRTFVSALINEKNKQSGWISSIVDISEPIKARQELALAQERFTTVLQSLDAAVSVISLQSGQLLFANRYYRDSFGNTTQAHLDLAGHEIDPGDIDAFDIDNVDGFAGLPASELTPGHSDSREILLPEFKKWFEVRRRYISWVDGHLAQLIVATDITERKYAEELARQQEEKMQFSSRLTTMGEMASSLAHELNQPLAAISNYCTGVANRLQSDKAVDIEKDILPAIEKATLQAHRAGTIIQRIRGFVKRSQPQRKIVPIYPIIEDSVGLAEIEAQRYDVEIKTTCQDHLPTVFIDPVLIQQVVVNLLKNAIDAVKKTPSSIKNGKSIDLKIDIDQSLNPQMLRIRVIDRGPGISEDAIDRLYEPFFSTKEDGMGMGLNICRSIIESHHGRLWATNHANEKDQSHTGCTFTILLPLDK